jgi:hypothetical protein
MTATGLQGFLDLRLVFLDVKTAFPALFSFAQRHQEIGKNVQLIISGLVGEQGGLVKFRFTVKTVADAEQFYSTDLLKLIEILKDKCGAVRAIEKSFGIGILDSTEAIGKDTAYVTILDEVNEWSQNERLQVYLSWVLTIAITVPEFWDHVWIRMDTIEPGMRLYYADKTQFDQLTPKMLEETYRHKPNRAARIMEGKSIYNAN